MKLKGFTSMDNLYDRFFSRRDSEEIIFYSRNAQYSFKELDSLVDKLAKHLYNENVKSLLIHGSNSFYFVAAYLASVKLGIDIIPVASGTPINQIEKILISNDCNTLISDSNLIINNTKAIDIKSLNDLAISIVTKDDGKLIMHSSGTSGSAKSIIISIKSHLEFLSLKKKSSFKIKAMVTSPFAHMNGLSSLETFLMVGASVVLVDKFDAIESLKLINDLKIQVITGTPTAIARMLTENNLNYNLDSVKKIVVSSAPITLNLIDKIKQSFKNASLKITYGSTEAGPGLFGDHPDNFPTPETSVGYPNKGVECRIRNSILEIKSLGMMSSYGTFDKSRITEDGFFITNDLFDVDNIGFYYFKGRADEMFTCGGDNIYPLDLENLIETYPSVESAIVVGVDDEVKGKKPYCFIVVKKEDKLDESAVKSFLSQQIKFNLVPRRLWEIKEIPLTNLNKPDKKYLTNLAREYLKYE